MTIAIKAAATEYIINDETFITPTRAQTISPITVNTHLGNTYTPKANLERVTGVRGDKTFTSERMTATFITLPTGQKAKVWDITEDGLYKPTGFSLNEEKNYTNAHIILVVGTVLYQLTDGQARRYMKGESLPIQDTEFVMNKENPLPAPPHPTLFDLEELQVA